MGKYFISASQLSSKLGPNLHRLVTDIQVIVLYWKYVELSKLMYVED